MQMVAWNTNIDVSILLSILRVRAELVAKLRYSREVHTPFSRELICILYLNSPVFYLYCRHVVFRVCYSDLQHATDALERSLNTTYWTAV